MNKLFIFGQAKGKVSRHGRFTNSFILSAYAIIAVLGFSIKCPCRSYLPDAAFYCAVVFLVQRYGIRSHYKKTSYWNTACSKGKLAMCLGFTTMRLQIDLSSYYNKRQQVTVQERLVFWIEHPLFINGLILAPKEELQEKNPYSLLN